MAKKSTSETPKSQCDFSNLILLALHVGVVAVSLWAHPVCFTPADKALPYVVPLD